MPSILLLTISVFCQRESVFIAPQTTDPSISTNLNNHYVSINRGLSPKNQLFLFFAGTGAVAFNYLQINNTAADLGFHSINLNYPNDQPVNGLCGAPNSDLNCYGDVRLETIDGIDRTARVNVNRANSIENRLIKLLIYLRQQYPSDNWGQFLIDDSRINWSKIIVSGHSQGGGHAGIIARYHSVIRAVKLAAQDFNGPSNALATWIGQPNTTPNASTPDKFWGFIHTRDELSSFTTMVSRTWPAYGIPQFGQVVNVDSAAPPYSNSHSLTSNRDCPESFHGCIAGDARLVFENGIPVYKPVWEYMLSNTQAPVDLFSVHFLRRGKIVPRPRPGISTKFFELVLNGSGFNPNTKVFINQREVVKEFINQNELRVALPAGKTNGAGSGRILIINQNGDSSGIISF